MVGVVVGISGGRRLDRCGFAVRPGEIVGLVGGTGSGKSTALQVAAGALAPDRGRLMLDGRDVTRNRSKLREAVGLLPHAMPGPFDLTIDEWLDLWASLDGQGLRMLTAAVRAVAADGKAVVIADSAPHLPASLCDRVVCLEAGAVVLEAKRGEADFEQHIASAQGWSA